MVRETVLLKMTLHSQVSTPHKTETKKCQIQWIQYWPPIQSKIKADSTGSQELLSQPM